MEFSSSEVSIVLETQFPTIKGGDISPLPSFESMISSLENTRPRFLKTISSLDWTSTLRFSRLFEDWGGEYQKLSQYLTTQGIIFESSCPHTPEQNGCAERKHRHVTELGRTLLHQATFEILDVCLQNSSLYYQQVTAVEYWI
ncbi:Retrovirus-related Pol polyprotein from transposon RE2 [Linum perenne]